MSQLTDRLERDLRQIAAGAQPSASAWDSIVARLDDDGPQEIVLGPTPGHRRWRRPVWPAIAAAVLVLAGSVAVLTRAVDDDVDTAGIPDLTATFVSPRNGFSVDHPEGDEVTVSPAEQLWEWAPEVDDGFDVVDTGPASTFWGASTELPDGDRPPAVAGTTDERVDDFLSNARVPSGGCGVPRSEQAALTIANRSGRVAECAGQIEATVVAGGRLYLFTLTHDRADARALFDAFVATVELRPETAVGIPALTTTFVSPTYGYSFGYYDRGGLEPATDVWDPVGGPVNTNLDDRFDAVETGFAGYFEGASTEIPDGVPTDAWVGEHVSSRLCGVISEDTVVDGQPGRVTSCPHLVHATVVAGGRLYLFSLAHDTDDREARALFDSWMATVDLTPETATVPSAGS